MRVQFPFSVRKVVIMRKSIEITGIIADNADTKKLKAQLESLGISNIIIKTLPQYDDWLSSLPSESVPGLKDACLAWIRYWGIGGGDSSTETCIADAITALKSDKPKELADAIYKSIADYTKTPFEAAGLTMELLNNCIDEF
jgi:hypothetical protein